MSGLGLRKSVRLIAFFAAGLLILVAPGFASNPTGVWQTRDKAEITIRKCGAQYCGAVSRAAKPGLHDINNPDPKLNGRPIEGIAILWVRESATPGILQGNLYNPLDGRTYEGTLELKNHNTLRVEGCVFKIFCRHEDWVRKQP